MNFNKNFLIGGVAGGIIGMTTALLFAPKSGKDLIKGMKDSLNVSLPSVPTRSSKLKKTNKIRKKTAKNPHALTDQPVIKKRNKPNFHEEL